MMRTRQLLILTSLAILGLGLRGPMASLYASSPVIDPKRAIVIEGVIAGGNLQALEPTMLSFLDGPDKSKPLDIIISSPGGDMMTGFFFLNVMDHLRAEGVRIRCYIPTMAASMAFQIFLHCDERYALEHSFLLWHGVRVMSGGGQGGVMTASQADDLARDLARADQMIVADLLATLGKYMSEADLLFHFHHETLHLAPQLAAIAPGFMEVRTSIPGLLEALLNKAIPRTAKVPLLNKKGAGGELEPDNDTCDTYTTGE